jgi:hypothetical protein
VLNIVVENVNVRTQGIMLRGGIAQGVPYTATIAMCCVSPSEF